MMQDSSEIFHYRQDFDAFYETNLKSLFVGLENKRKTYLKAFIISSFLVFFIMPAGMYWLFLHFYHIFSQMDVNSYSDTLPWIFLIGGGIVALPIKLYKNQNKSIIMPEFIKFFEGFEYNKENFIPDDIISQSKIMPFYEEKEHDDFFVGSYKDVAMTISEEKLVKIQRTNKGVRRNTLFRGVFVSLEMNKNFEGQTIGLKDKGILNSFNKPKGFENVKLEDTTFEKIWEIYSDNQIEARYLLTTAFMDRLLKVKTLFNGKSLTFSFFDNILFLAIDMRKDMFETSSLFKSTANKQHINETLEQFLSIMAIVDILKLNQRIGM
ncbi:MAG: DUF3137 domain-containing protein [Alphaproteobacteria bacterium]